MALARPPPSLFGESVRFRVLGFWVCPSPSASSRDFCRGVCDFGVGLGTFGIPSALHHMSVLQLHLPFFCRVRV